MVFTTALDDLDDETARVILTCQLQDLERFRTDSILGADHEFAWHLAQQEARNYAAIRGLEIETPGGNEAEMRDAITRTAASDPTSATSAPPAFGPATVTITTTPDHVECISCSTEVPDGDIYKAPCEHDYCDNCLEHVFSHAIRDERMYPPACCKQAIPFDDVRDFLATNIAEEFIKRKPELDDPQRLYCHIPTCSQYISHEARADDVGTCPACDASTCVICKGETHKGDCPEDEGIKGVEELAKKEGWRRCPVCNRMVELRTGCNHMTCLCKAEFCYVCGSHPWKRPETFIRTCDCPQFDENRLLERAEEIVNREGRGQDARVMAEIIRENHECEDHDWDEQWGRFQCDGCDDWVRLFIMRCTNCHMQRCRRCINNGAF